MTLRIALPILLLLGGISTGTAAETDFSVCLETIEKAPDAVEGYMCIRWTGRSSGDLAGALDELGRLEAIRGPSPELRLARGNLLADLRDPRATTEITAAVEGCRKAESSRCEVLALLESASLRKLWDAEGADTEIDLAGEVARLSEDTDLVLRVRVAEAWRALDNDQPAMGATELEMLLAECETPCAIQTKATIIEGLGLAAWSTGRLSQSREFYRDLFNLAETEGDTWLAARASASFTLLDLNLESPEPASVRGRIARLVEQARDASNPIAEIKLRVLYAQTLATPEAINQWQVVHAMSKRYGALEDELLALRMLARNLMRSDDPSGAIAAMDEAREVANVHGLRDAEIRSCAGGLELRWEDGRLAEARERMDDCLELIDRLRDRQDLPVDRARVSSQFSHIPRHMADALLSLENDVDGALQVLERLRPSNLGGATEPDGAAAIELAQLRRRLTGVQRELAYGLPTENRRRELEHQLQQLEADELRLIRAATTEAPPAEPLKLGEVQTFLDDDETLVVFSMIEYPTDSWQTTGSWAIVVTRNGSRAIQLPSFDTFGPAIDALAGLLDRTDRVARIAAARVYELLFREVSDELDQVRHLIVLLDEPLHELPLAALRPTADSPPLVSHIDIEFVPSLADWRRWRRRRADQPPPGNPLVVADPRLAAADDAVFRDARLPAVAELGRLPGAADEGERISRMLGSGTRLLAGGRASEAAVRTAVADRPRVLHIAAHAIVDSRHSGRSAIVLAPGKGHDGLLQARDIAGLSLEGSLVVLSACRSLDGEVVDGGGIVGLGSAFLSAGARAVIGAVRPLDDRGIPDLMDEFYRELERGAPVARALAHAQAVMASKNRPPADWATMLLVGDGAMTVALQAVPEKNWFGWRSALAVSGALAVFLVLPFARRRYRRRAS